MKLSRILAAIILGAFVVSAVPGPALAVEVFEKVGTFGAQFLKIGPSARAAGLGSAYVAVADDANAIYWNPAGIVNIRGSELSISQTEWPADINLSYAAYVFNPRSIPGTFGISARALWMDPQIVRTAFEPEGNGQTFDSGMSSLGLTYARYFTDKFSAGITGHFLHMGLAEASVNSAALDVGILYRIGIRGMKVGMTIQSLGSEVTFDERSARLPTMFKVGFAFDPIRAGSQTLMATGEFQHPVDNKERSNFGLEYNLRDTFFLRTGYNMGYDTDGVAAGAGFRVKTGRTSRAQLDYGWVDMASLGSVHRVSVSFGY